jgi:hypothetical protein
MGGLNPEGTSMAFSKRIRQWNLRRNAIFGNPQLTIH